MSSSQLILNSVQDLRTYLDNHYVLVGDELDYVTDVINRRTKERPSYGDCWQAYLDSLDGEIYVIASDSE